MTRDRQAPGKQAEPGHYVVRILDELAKEGTRPVIRWRDTVITASEIRETVLLLATAMRERGLEAGGTVAILTEVNSPWMLTARYSAHLLGATVVYITGANHGTTTHDLSVDTRARMVRESKASVLVFDETNAPLAVTIRDLVSAGVALCGLGELASGAVSVDGRPVPAALKELAPQVPERAMVLYTSGSTGQPKGVCKPFSSWNDVVLGESAAAAPKAFLAVSAASHTVGLLVDTAIASGGNVLLRTGFDASTFLRDIERYRITDTLIGVPLLYDLLNHPDLNTTDLSSLRRLLYVGCPASPERVKEAVQIFPGILNHSYGTTETGRIAMLTAADHDHPELLSTVGRPRTDVRIAIQDPETGHSLAIGEVGEVVVHSPHNMEGYVDDPERTAQVLRDGWIRTGDFGSLGIDGYLRLFGRMKDIVKVHDTKVSPTEVEKVLVGHASVVDACVYGHRRADLVEELHAAVVLGRNDQPSFQALREHVAHAMTPTHAPIRFVSWRKFPLNNAGKVDRVLIRETGSEFGDEDEELLVGK